MSSFFINFDADQSILKVGFGNPAANSQIVQDAAERLEEIKASGDLQGGPLLRVYGPASLPCAFTIGHAVSHAYDAVAVWDPKVQKYVVSVAHGPTYNIGDEID